MKSQNKLLIKKGGSSLLEDSSDNIPIPDNTWSMGLGKNSAVLDNLMSNEVIQDGSGKTVKKTTTKKSVSKKPAAKKTVAKKSVSEKPVAKKTTAKKSVSEKPAEKKTTAKKSVSEKPVAKKTVAKKSVSEKPVANKTIRNILNDFVKKIKNITK